MIPEGKPTTGRPKKGSYRESRNYGIYIRASGDDLMKLDAICKMLGITRTDYILSKIDIDYERMAYVKKERTRKAEERSSSCKE